MPVPAAGHVHVTRAARGAPFPAPPGGGAPPAPDPASGRALVPRALRTRASLPGGAWRSGWRFLPGPPGDCRARGRRGQPRLRAAVSPGSSPHPMVPVAPSKVIPRQGAGVRPAAREQDEVVKETAPFARRARDKHRAFRAIDPHKRRPRLRKSLEMALRCPIGGTLPGPLERRPGQTLRPPSPPHHHRPHTRAGARLGRAGRRSVGKPARTKGVEPRLHLGGARGCLLGVGGLLGEQAGGAPGGTPRLGAVGRIRRAAEQASRP